MQAAATTTATDSRADGAWRRSFRPPDIDLSPWTAADIDRFFRGEAEADDCERFLVWSARARGALDLALGEGLHALRQGDRLASLGYHLDDYAREVLDLRERTALGLARLGRELRTRPILREALRSGRVRLRAAETVLPVAVGDSEAVWVDRAARLTVRQLGEEVRRAGGEPGDSDEPWLRMRALLGSEEREVVDVALQLAGQLMPGASRTEALEAMSQEFLAEHPGDPDPDDARDEARMRTTLGATAPPRSAEMSRRAALEGEMEGWASLPTVDGCAAPAELDGATTAREVDDRLRALARLRARWDELVGHCAYAIQRSGIHLRMGFATFRHYVEERLQLPARAVEQRVALERRISVSPALQEARRQKLPYEKLRVLSLLVEEEIRGWTLRARRLTCVELRRRVEGEKERQMRAVRQLAVPLPRRVAVLLAAAIEVVRERVGRALTAGKALVLIAWHFIETWLGVAKDARSRSQKVRTRDAGLCQTPGCSHRAADAHHVEFRSHGGGDEMDNLVSLCGFHHRCIHDGFLHLVGRAPDRLTWSCGGRRWTGRG